MTVVPHSIWTHGHSLHLDALSGEVEADVCVIGLGGSGLTCIHALLDAGKSVIGIDAAEVAAGAAGSNGGFLLGGLAMFHHDAVERFGRQTARRLYASTLAQLDRIIAETPRAVHRTGTLRIATSDAERDDCARQYEAMRADELPVDRYEGPEGDGLLFPADAAFDPGQRCRALADQARARGARLYEKTPAVEITDGRVVSERGAVRARDIVVAVDGRLEALVPELAPRVRTARLQMLATAPLSARMFARPVYARWGLDYWQQRDDLRVVLGGARDLGGVSEWSVSTEITEPVQSALDALLRERLGIREPVTHRWAASVGYTASGLPVIEQVRPHVWAIGGYSGTGNVVGALCGRAVADLVVRGRSATADLLRA
ncbi:MAG TPA: FAD-dependent oxidoreductase [Gemmatimonadaceae bacterium]|nr:FAD-dependent oxidoreductase [Gemmatimonadaceae bacterium]